MSREVRTFLCALVMFGGLYMLFRMSFQYAWTPNQIVSSQREVRKLRARNTVLARRSPVARRLYRWANGEHAETDVADDVRALLESYDVVLGKLAQLRARDEAAKAVVQAWRDHTEKYPPFRTNVHVREALDALARAHEGEGRGPVSELPYAHKLSVDQAVRYLRDEIAPQANREMLAGAARTVVAALERQDAPIDWPARFRAAGEVAVAAGIAEVDGFNLRMAALWLESPNLPPDVVDAIGRALLGEVDR